MTESLTGSAERFVRALERGAWDAAAALVSSDVAAGVMSPPRLAELWAQLVGHLGPLAALTPLGETIEEGRRVCDLAGRFERSEVTLRVVHDALGRVAGFWVTPPRAPGYEPPAYADPSRFAEVETTVGAEPALGATLTLPRDGRGWPVVVLVHGSGPNDRDERIGATRPFRDLAWGLATRGVAVLRYDKRTQARPDSIDPRTVTVEAETILDAVAALGAARAVDGVDPGRVVVLGHSLGATFAPEIARRDGGVAGVVMLAPGGRPAAESAMAQVEHLASLAEAEGQPTGPLAQVRAQLAELAERRLAPGTAVLGAPAAYWYDLDDRAPLAVGRALRVPVLALFGGRDYQVTDADVALWREALAGRPDAEVRELPRLDHLFREGEGTATPADYLVRPGHVAAEVVELLAAWIHERAPVVPA